MDVQADQASVGSDPAATIARGGPVPLGRSAPSSAAYQGSFFHDPYPTFAQTDPTPVVSPRAPKVPRPHRRVKGSPGLRLAVVLAALAVAAAATTLGLVESGVIKTPGNTTKSAATNSARNSATSAPATHSATHRTTPATKPLLTGSGLGSGSANYTVDASAYGLTIATTTGRSWVSVGPVGQNPIFAGIVDAHSSQHWTLMGPAQIQIGAGGTTVTVTSKHRSQSLNPPSAPYTFNFTPS
jgi:hypothetical protein